jgi:hypothetical protein
MAKERVAGTVLLIPAIVGLMASMGNFDHSNMGRFDERKHRDHFGLTDNSVPAGPEWKRVFSYSSFGMDVEEYVHSATSESKVVVRRDMVFLPVLGIGATRYAYTYAAIVLGILGIMLLLAPWR